MGLLDFLRFTPPKPVAEAHSPVPKQPLLGIDPIGFGTDIKDDTHTRKTPSEAVDLALQAASSRARADRYRDFNAMDAGDIAAMLDGVVTAALTFASTAETTDAFKIELDDVSTSPELTLLQTAAKTADVTEIAEEVLRDLLKYGDAFIEPLFKGTDLIGIQTYSPEEIFITKDAKNNFVKGKDDEGFYVAYQQRRNGTTVAGWQPWELIHFQLHPTRKSAYSKGLLDDLRVDWTKLQIVEQGMIIARVTRAYVRRTHYVDLTNVLGRQEQEKTLKGYIQRLTAKAFGKRQTTHGIPNTDVAEDLFIGTGYTTGPDGTLYTSLNKTELESPSMAGLSELADVHYLRSKVWSIIPSDLVGYGEQPGGDLTTQDIAYSRLLLKCQRQLAKGLRVLFDQVLLAKSITKPVPYKLVFPSIESKDSWRHSAARMNVSLTLRNYLEAGVISRQYAVKQAFNLTDSEIETMWKELEREAEMDIFKPSEADLQGAGVTPATNINKSTKSAQAVKGHASGGATASPKGKD